jgi:superfamily II DNA/RNA helicase
MMGGGVDGGGPSSARPTSAKDEEFDHLVEAVRANIASQRKSNLDIDQRQTGEVLEEYPATAEAFWAQFSISVKHKAKPVPPTYPNLSFEDTRFSDAIKKKLAHAFEHPSPIQSQSWPYCMEGKNLVCIAKTGSGKTLAYTLPALHHVIKARAEAAKLAGEGLGDVAPPRNRRSGRRSPRAVKAIFIAPTRELAQQIADQVCLALSSPMTL